MIHVCFPLYDQNGTYSKYLGTAIASMFQKTEKKVHVHLLHDNTLTEKNREKFLKLSNVFQQRISFYTVDITQDICELKTLPVFTIGTLFRLKIPSILPEDIKKIIYMDADVLVNLDINDLWSEGFNGNSILAVANENLLPENSKTLFEAGILNPSTYFNAGVMAWDLERIRRKHRLFSEAVQFLEKYPSSPFLDQDALNYIFFNDVRHIERKYNWITISCRKKKESLQERIYHFAGDHPYISSIESFDQLFWSVLFSTPWGDVTEIQKFYIDAWKLVERKLFVSRKIIQSIRNRSLVFWGASGMLIENIMSLFEMNSSLDFIVDNNPKMHRKCVNGLKVYSPQVLKDRKQGEIYVIVISNLHYTEIKYELERMGFVELQDFADGRLLLLERENGSYVL